MQQLCFDCIQCAVSLVTSLYSGFSVLFFTVVLNLDFLSLSGLRYLQHEQASQCWDWPLASRVQTDTAPRDSPT